ncbi:hypothetical protein ACFPM7_05555 [Actinokineospora guangxiensis]|uniref:EF-hand domain-containing protein n=1 Tax=Actinokineospora guangxiensis TaxID=1490288 RepID=A0ABW0EJV8_9PSEU
MPAARTGADSAIQAIQSVQSVQPAQPVQALQAIQALQPHDPPGCAEPDRTAVTLPPDSPTPHLRGTPPADPHPGGAITRAEFHRLLTALGHPAADAAFTALDRDHDDRITRAEYVAAWEDHLLGDSPDAARAIAFTGL